MFRVKNTRATTVTKNTNISPNLSHQQPLIPSPSQISNMNKPVNPKPKTYNIHQVKKLQTNVSSKIDSAHKDIITKNKLVQYKNNDNRSKYNVNANINSKIQILSNNNKKGPNAGRNMNVNSNIGTFAITNNSKLANTLGSRKNKREDTLTKTNKIEKQSKEFQQKVIRGKQVQIQLSVNIEQIKINDSINKISKQQKNQLPKHVQKQVPIQRSSQKQQQKQKQIKKQKQQQQARKIQLQKEKQMKKLRKQQQDQQQKKRIEEAQAQIAKIMQRRKQRQQERSRMKQIQQKRQKQLKQLAQHLQSNPNANTDINRGGMLYTTDPLAHFEFAQKIMNLQINKILKMSFHSFPSGQMIQRKKQELQRINNSYMMIRDDVSANQRMKEGLNGYRTQLFNDIGELIVNDQKKGYNNPNFRIIQSDHTNKLSPQVVLTRGIPSHKISAILKPSIANTNQYQCSICLNYIQKQTNYYRLVCGHNFHIQCTEDWVSNTGNCPVCRKNLKF